MITELSSPKTELSIIVPILNEQESLPELYEQLTCVLRRLQRTYEIICVDDGSTDASVQVCRALAEADAHLVLVELRRQFGKATALQVGFQIAQGEVIITMDADLQDDAQEIPRFLETLENGFDLVSGWKQQRQDPLSKTLPSRLFNYVTALVTGVRLRDFNCGFKAYRRAVVESLDIYGELYRYIPVLAHAKGFRIGEIPVRHHPRRYGASKYGMGRLFKGACDLLTILFLCGFYHCPLHLFGLIGLVFTLIGGAIDGYLSLRWLTGMGYLSNRPLLIFGTLLITVGIQLFGFGLLAEAITASTYRRADVMTLIRRVARPAAVRVSQSDG